MRVKNLASAIALLATFGCKKEAVPVASESASPSASAALVTAPAPPKPTGPRADDLKLPTLGAVPVPADNPQSDAKVALGNQLFFDKRLSADGSRSCYSCHLNEDGTGGHLPIAVGAKEKTL